jgi:hypothetical protein
MGIHGQMADFCGFLTGTIANVLALFLPAKAVDKSVT